MRFSPILAWVAITLCACTSAPTGSQRTADHSASEGAPAGPRTAGSGKDAAAARAPLIVTGTRTLVGSPPAEPAATEQIPGSAGFQLNFVDTDIAAVVGTVMGDGLNLPYVIDPQVKGTITLQAARALSSSDVMAALEAALRTQGIAIVNSNGVYHVVPMRDASKRVATLRVPGQGAPGFGIYVVPLQFVSAEEMEKTLKPFAPDGGIVRVDEARNLLLLAGTSQEITTVLNIVKTFDVDWLAGMSFALYPLEYVDAKTLAGELAEVFSDPKSPIAGVVRFVPLSRLNSLMVVTPQPKYLQDVEAWIKRLDLGVTTPGRRIYVYDVQNAKADELAASLSQILSLATPQTYAPNRNATNAPGSALQGGGFGSSMGPGGTSPSLGASLGSNSSALSAYSAGSQPLTVQGTVRESTGFSNGPAVTGPTGQASSEPGSLKIVPNAENNSILVYATPTEFAVIESALKRLDVLPIEILIEASIAEITLTDELQYGLQWAYQGPKGPVVFSESSTGSVKPQFPGFSYLYTGSASISAVLNSLETITHVRVLSAPKLVVLNNHEANLEVGDQVPVVTQSSVSTNDANAPIVNSVQLLDTGVILHVTPRANKSGRVLLEVDQEVSDVVPTTSSSINSPTIQQRKISSTVAVRDGDTIALGGLIQDSHSSTRNGLPILSRIPILGGLFGSTDRTTTRTELIVLITPHVVRSEQESDEMMEDLREQFRSLRPLVPSWQKGGKSPPNSGIPASQAPSVPESPSEGRGAPASVRPDIKAPSPSSSNVAASSLPPTS